MITVLHWNLLLNWFYVFWASFVAQSFLSVILKHTISASNILNFLRASQYFDVLALSKEDPFRQGVKNSHFK